MPKVKSNPASVASELYSSYIEDSFCHEIVLSKLFERNTHGEIVFKRSIALRNAVEAKFRTMFKDNVIYQLGKEYATILVDKESEPLSKLHLRLHNDGTDPLANAIYAVTRVKIGLLYDTLKEGTLVVR
jgi:hypothetical protein